MLGLDQNGVYLVAAFAVTVLVLGGYTLYLWSRLKALRRRRAEQAPGQEVQAATGRARGADLIRRHT
jgi:CcmD family protein